jgi:hypothetical protein
MVEARYGFSIVAMHTMNSDPPNRDKVLSPKQQASKRLSSQRSGKRSCFAKYTGPRYTPGIYAEANRIRQSYSRGWWESQTQVTFLVADQIKQT